MNSKFIWRINWWGRRVCKIDLVKIAESLKVIILAQEFRKISISPSKEVTGDDCLECFWSPFRFCSQMEGHYWICRHLAKLTYNNWICMNELSSGNFGKFRAAIWASNWVMASRRSLPVKKRLEGKVLGSRFGKQKILKSYKFWTSILLKAVEGCKRCVTAVTCSSLYHTGDPAMKLVACKSHFSITFYKLKTNNAKQAASLRLGADRLA